MSSAFQHSSAIKEFLAESIDQLERMTLLLTAGEETKTPEEQIHALNRELHSMKGNAQLFGFQQLASLAHALESSVEFSRKRGDFITPELSDEIFRGIGLLEKIVGSLNALGHEGDHETLVAKLVSAISENVARRMQLTASLLRTEAKAPTPTVAITPTKPTTPKPSSPESIETASVSPVTTAAKDLNKIEVKASAEAPAVSVPNTQPTPAAGVSGDSNADTLRVQVSLLDSLMNFVGELVLVRNQVIQKANQQSEDAEFSMLSQRLDVITNELQNEVMKTRMQPIGNILTKFHRLTRDMARDLNKDIQLKLEGVETELDKTLIEAVKDPLTHIIRNSMDHGLESKEDRALTQKPKVGSVTIRAYHEGGQIVIEVNDDGKGLQRQKIAQKALEKGLITQEQLKKYSDKDICNLIFLPGFSTAEKVSNISGRGVGMDVVRTNIEKIGGVVDIQSTEGQGSTIRLKIPLTLAIVPALLVKTKGQRFAIPQVKLTELVRISKDERANENRIEYIQGRPVFRLRGSLLPVVSLARTLGIGSASDTDLRYKDEINIVVLQLDSGLFALVVDEIDDSVDIVVKSLSGLLKSLTVYSGATVLGDGNVALVLDVVGLANLGKTFLEKREIDKDAVPRIPTESDEITEYLLVDIGLEGRYCIPLYVISRLEELSFDELEQTGDQIVVRYRKTVLPLINVSSTLGAASSALSAKKSLQKREKCSVVVIQQAEKIYGLVVDSILDIVGIAGPINDEIRNKDCLLGTIFHQDHIVSVIDVYKTIDKHFPLISKTEARDAPRHRGPMRVIYAEDSPFFQKQITSLLRDQGFIVTPVPNGEEALQRLLKEGPSAFDVLVSDLDMPLLDGFGLIERLRATEDFKTFPAYALSSRAKSLTEKIAVKAGFLAYVEKADIKRLIDNIWSHSQLVEDMEVKRGA